MALNPPDRSGDRIQGFEHGSDKPKIQWWDGPAGGGYPDPSSKADSYHPSQDVRFSPAHADAHEVVIHHPDPLSGQVRAQRYNRVNSSMEKGVKGVVGHANNGSTFIPNSDIAEMRVEEREGALPGWERERNYRAGRLAAGFDD
jgi:hypothetical protein